MQCLLTFVLIGSLTNAFAQSIRPLMDRGLRELAKPIDTLKRDTIDTTRTILLDEVSITIKTNYLNDSLLFRKQYSSIFNQQKPSWKELFASKNYFDNTPIPYNKAVNSTASIVSLNLLSVINLFGKNKTSSAKLKKVLQQEELERYFDHMFSQEKIQTITGLKGDSLVRFIQQYRPVKEEIRKMTDYELMIYIKKSCDDYRKAK